MRKEYLEKLKSNDAHKTLKYLKALYKTINENPTRFQNNAQIKRLLKNKKNL